MMLILDLPPLSRARLISLGAHPRNSLSHAAVIAAQEGNARLLSLLIINGADPKDESSACPLELAARHGHEQCVALLLPHITNPDRLYQALKGAAKFGFLECATLLANALGPGTHFQQPLMLACIGSHRSTAEFLMPLVEPSAEFPDMFAIVAWAKQGAHHRAGAFLEILAERMLLNSDLPDPNPSAPQSKSRL